VIPYGRQDISENDIKTVVETLKSDYLTQGPRVGEFEKALCDITKANHAIAVNSATSALHIACLALGVGRGDYVWTSPITFVASANCAKFCGAEVDFVDIDPQTFNMCPTALEQKLELAKKEGRLPKVIIPVHMAGQSPDMSAISALAKRYGASILEDASHAIGASYRESRVGSCEFSDITVFSFHPVKIVTTGEGGAAVCRDSNLANKMRLLSSHGVTRDPEQMDHSPDGAWYYQQIELGFNYRLTEIQAALGISQLSRLDDYIERRRAIAAQYDDAFAACSFETPAEREDCKSSFHLYILQLSNRDRAFQRLRNAGILVNVHYIPVHTQPYYRKLGFREGDFPVAEAYYKAALSIPLFPTMTENQIEEVIATVKEAAE